jgi:AraC family transcriptional regulator
MSVLSAGVAHAIFDRSHAMSKFVGPSASLGPGRPAAISPFRMRRVLQHVDENLHRRIGLQELATLAGLSPWYFCRAFKRETGLPPNRYILALRLDRACRLLASPGARLADVAAAVGFSSQAHFTSAFTRMLGMPPGRWRALPSAGATGIADA